uniref:DUF3846 domain-containing protein n=1 Tax=Rhizobium rhizogenes TaxID=359 RepID=A0A7S4ZU31_RHIRH|nr:DUF3846 domain-containing protein [Rhizobium rhizogenes]QCL09859.1 hypothetical protein pC5.8b_369 [Rhizobium rhizogenes]
MSEIKSHLLNAAAGTIRTMTLPANDQLKHVYELIGCSTVDVARIDDSHVVYVDENGLVGGLSCVTDLKGHPSPLAGNLLIVGDHENGETTSVSASIEDVAAWFTIVRPVFVPVFETLSGPDIFGTRVIRLDVRIERSTPNIIDQPPDDHSGSPL